MLSHIVLLKTFTAIKALSLVIIKTFLNYYFINKNIIIFSTLVG